MYSASIELEFLMVAGPLTIYCGATLTMTGIEPIGLGTDRRTFECDQCGHEEELLVNSFH